MWRMVQGGGGAEPILNRKKRYSSEGRSVKGFLGLTPEERAVRENSCRRWGGIQVRGAQQWGKGKHERNREVEIWAVKAAEVQQVREGCLGKGRGL